MDIVPNGADEITAAGVRGYLGPLAERIGVQVLPVCQSTNLLLKQQAAGLPEWHTLIAGYQTGGRGRSGRSFFSPEGSGLYMSVLLRPRLPAEDAVLITAAAAVAVCRAAEQLGADSARIKWVNDVFLRGRKVCGILTEACSGQEPGALGHVVLGIGVNVTEPDGGFPPDIADTAGAMFPAHQSALRARLAAAILRQLYSLYAQLPRRDFVTEYQARSLVVGREVDVLQNGAVRRALALAVDDRCRLVVRYPDGEQRALFSGEVSIRPAGAK